MTTIEQLDIDVKDIIRSLDSLIELVQEMNKGLYGDPKNKHVGVIEKQAEMEKEIEGLRKDIEGINRRNIELDIILKAKKTFKDEAINWGQRLVAWIMQGLVLYAIFKGILGVDALLK